MMYLDERKERARKMREEEAKIGPRMPDRRFESTDWANTEYQPLLILEIIDNGIETHIYGPYTNTADLMHAYARLTYFNPFEEPEGYDDGYTYELRPLEGKI